MRGLLAIGLMLAVLGASGQSTIVEGSGNTSQNRLVIKGGIRVSQVAALPAKPDLFNYTGDSASGAVVYCKCNADVTKRGMYFWKVDRWVRLDSVGTGGGGGGISKVLGEACLIEVNDSTLAVDTTCVATKWRLDSLGAVKLNIADTMSMLHPYIRYAYRVPGKDSLFFVRGDGGIISIKDSVGMSVSDTTVYNPVIDSTGQGLQRVLFAINNRIYGSPYLTYDSTNKRLFVNMLVPTGNPAIKLGVNGDGYFSGTIESVGPWSPGQLVLGALGQAGRVSFRRGSDGSPVTYLGYASATEASIFRFYNGGGSSAFTWITNDGSTTTDRMRLIANGNLGIGTTSPSAKLQIVGGLAQTDGGFTSFNTGTANAISVFMRTVTTTASGFIAEPTDMASSGTPIRWSPSIRLSGMGWNGSASMRQDWYVTNKPLSSTEANLAFHYGSGADVAVINSRGNFGIGTSTPNSALILDVASTSKAFAPPRMTTTQMNAIASPPAGAHLFNTTRSLPYWNNGTGWLTSGLYYAESTGNYYSTTSGRGGSGTGNVLVGDSAGGSLVTGNSNIVIGRNALRRITNDGDAIAIGTNAGAVFDTATGGLGANIFIGTNAGAALTTGSGNTFIGPNAGRFVAGSNRSRITAIGGSAFAALTSGSGTAIGSRAGLVSTTGTANTFVGEAAGYNSTTGSNLVAVGSEALTDVIMSPSASNIVGVGIAAGGYGAFSVAIGNNANRGNSGAGVVAVGANALGQTVASASKQCDGCIAIGRNALSHPDSSSKYNTAIGFNNNFGNHLVTSATRFSGTYNTTIGASISQRDTSGSNQLRIGGNGVEYIERQPNGNFIFNSTSSSISSPSASVAAGFYSTSGGVLIPRFTSANKLANISSPAEGLAVFDTSSHRESHNRGTGIGWNDVVYTTDLLQIVPVSGTSQTGASNTLYITYNASLTTISLPPVSASDIGKVFQVTQSGTGPFRISQTGSQYIVSSAGSTTVGASGYIQSTTSATSVTLRYVDTNKWTATADKGTYTIN